MADSKYPIIVVCGPTAVGKTKLGVELAKKFNGEIISTDSRQFFREMSIGTAKPTIEEMDGIPHHFIDSHSISENYAAGKFEFDALACIEEIHSRNKLPILVGGSGLYIKAVLEGLDPLPSDPQLREDLNQKFEQDGLEAIQSMLKSLDLDYYNAIDNQNHIRIIRGIEIIQLTGKSMKENQQGQVKDRPFSPIIIGLDSDREQLYDRINLRVDIMLAGGLIEEVKSLIPYKEKQALQSVGYREFFDYFDEKTSLAQAIELVKRNSRRYAKRQLTWLRSMPNVKWFDAGNDKAITADIARLLTEFQ